MFEGLELDYGRLVDGWRSLRSGLMRVVIAARRYFLRRLMRDRNNSHIAINTTLTAPEFLWNALRGILGSNALFAADVFLP
jgi:hypothetical protein